MANSFLRGCGNIDGNKSASPTDRDLAELYETVLGAAITDENLSSVAYIAYFPGHISMAWHNCTAYRIRCDSTPLRLTHYRIQVTDWRPPTLWRD